MSDSIQYWAFRIDKRRIEYIGGEARQGRLRQGWGWLDGQDLNLPPDKFVDQGAGRNRRPMRKVKKDDVILVPRLPSWSQIAIFTATEDWCSGYRYAEKEGNEGDSYRHVFPVKFEGQFGRHDSHVSGDIRRTFKNLSRFWNITGYAEDIEVIRGTELTEVQKNQGYNDRLQDAIQNSFDRKEFEKDVCAEINKQFEGTAWEFILVDVLQQLNPHFSVERVGGITEGLHGTDILMVSKPATGLARILHEQCEVEVFWVWSDKPGLQGLHGVHDRLFRYDWADFGRTSPNPRCLSTCRGSTRRGSGGVQANGHHTEQLLVRTGTAQQ